MKLTKRQAQVGEIIRRHFSMVLMEEGSYIYGHEPLVTVTSVQMSPDLGIAKIYLSVYNVEQKMNVIDLLSAHNTTLRQGLANRVKKHLRRAPYIDLFLDETLDEMDRVEGIFDKLEKEGQMGKEEE